MGHRGRKRKVRLFAVSFLHTRWSEQVLVTFWVHRGHQDTLCTQIVEWIFQFEGWQTLNWAALDTQPLKNIFCFQPTWGHNPDFHLLPLSFSVSLPDNFKEKQPGTSNRMPRADVLSLNGALICFFFLSPLSCLLVYMKLDIVQGNWCLLSFKLGAICRQFHCVGIIRIQST